MGMRPAPGDANIGSGSLAAQEAMKTVTYRILRKLLLVQQRWADQSRTPPDSAPGSEPGGLVRRVGLSLLRHAFGLARWLIKPEMRTRIRIWMTDMGNPCEGEERRPNPITEMNGSGGMDGINLIGYLRAELGLGESARSTLRAAAAANIHVSAVDYRAGCSARNEEEIDTEIPTGQRHAINVFHMNADQLYVAFNALGSDFFNGHYNIVYCVWEQGEFPEDWVPALNFVDEVWTASTFCQDTISRKTDKPVVRMPHNVQPVPPHGIDRRALGLPEDDFIFLGMADFMSAPERKNPLGSLEAYVRSMCLRMENVSLVLKTVNTGVRKDVAARLEHYRERFPSIILIDGYLSRPEVNALFQCCDCFVSLHRAEGFGLPMAEAMYFGKPVIATGWSGNVDFMNVTNSLLVRYTVVELDHDTGSYRKGFHWAEPDIDHAAELMGVVASDENLAKRIGQAGQMEIKTNFSPARVGRLMRDRLHRIKRGFA